MYTKPLFAFVFVPKNLFKIWNDVEKSVKNSKATIY